MVPGFGILLGMDVIDQLGGVLVHDVSQTMVFGNETERRMVVKLLTLISMLLFPMADGKFAGNGYSKG